MLRCPMRDVIGMTDEVKRALVVAAHADDPEFGCGGTVALWSRSGWEFYYLILTDGSKGSDDPEMIPERLVTVRQQEQRAAASILGVKEVFFLDYEDGELTYTRDLLRDVVRYIRRLKPHAVFTSDPTTIFHSNSFINHKDHRCAGLVAVDAVYPVARDRLNMPELLDEGLEPHKVMELYLAQSNEPNLDVDITEVGDLKITALLEHKSQFGHRGEEMLQRWRERWQDPDGRFREHFRHIALPF